MKQITIMSLSALFTTAMAKCDPNSIQATLPQGASVNFAYSVAANSTFEVPKSNTG